MKVLSFRKEVVDLVDFIELGFDVEEAVLLLAVRS